MLFNRERLEQILSELKSFDAQLVAVSKTKSPEAIKAVYDFGHKAFGENYVQELTEKQPSLPADIHWHYIGHLQSNKTKLIVPFVSLIHAADSLKLLQEINKQGMKHNRTVNCLLQIHIADEETKFGLSFEEARQLVESPELEALRNISLKGLMGMATLTNDEVQIRKEFRSLKIFFETLRKTNPQFNTLSMGMTSDYKIALEEGSSMVRIGSAIFGER